MNPRLIIFTDIGDTIIDEGSEMRNEPFGVVLRADCIPGAKETMLKLYEMGYTIAMVADGYVQSFKNTMEQNGLEHIFSAKAISEPLNTHKPDPVMFQFAMDRLGLVESDKNRIIMVGNNLTRDIAGANRFGITSVHLAWTERYPKTPSCEDERPDYRIDRPEELLNLVEKLNAELLKEDAANEALV